MRHELQAAYTASWEMVAPGQLSTNPELALVTFHTGFNVVGAMAFLPFTYKFARAIKRIFSTTMPQFTENLELQLLAQPSLALTALQKTVQHAFVALLRHISRLLGDERSGHRLDLRQFQEELDQPHTYADQIHPKTDAPEWQRLIALLHTLDHMQRLHERCEEEEDRAITARRSPPLKTHHDQITRTIHEMLNDIARKEWQSAVERADKMRQEIHKAVQPYRGEVIAQMTGGELDVTRGAEQLQAIRWLRRVSRHIARIGKHFYGSLLAAGDSQIK